MSGEIFGPIFVPDRFREAVSGRSWLRAMLDAEAALASAEARVGLVPEEAAATIVSCCEATRFDPEPARYLGSTGAFIDRAMDLYRKEVPS